MQQKSSFICHKKAKAIKELEAAKKACETALKHIETMIRVEKGDACKGDRPLHDWYPVKGDVRGGKRPLQKLDTVKGDLCGGKRPLHDMLLK